MTESVYVSDADKINETPSAASVAGEVMRLADGTAAVRVSSVAADQLGAVYVVGQFNVGAASGTTFSDGEEVWWDASANLAINKGSAGDGDWYLGKARAAKTSGTLYVLTELNAATGSPSAPSLRRSRVLIIDCESGATNASTVLIPAEDNVDGILVKNIYGRIVEVFGGASQDQGIITVSDESNNALGTLTATDGGADALKDAVIGSLNLDASATGALAGKYVAAGEFVDLAVTQATSGASAAGKMAVWCEYYSFPSVDA